jgi:hypothetical protein
MVKLNLFLPIMWYLGFFHFWFIAHLPRVALRRHKGLGFQIRV